jgi:hypothetical protein
MGIDLNAETIALFRQAQEGRTINTTAGLIGYDLEAPAKVIVPVTTPLVNLLPRQKGKGIDVTHWKAITSFDTARSLGALADGATPTQVSYAVANLQNSYQSIALSNAVTFQAQWRGRSLEGDVRARRTAELLYQLKIVEERWLVQGSQLLMAPPAPVVSTAASGGAIAAGTYWLQVTATNAQGETLPSALPGTSAGPTAVVTTSGSTSTITITLFTVPNAAGYNVYIGSGSTPPANGAMWKQTGLTQTQPAFGSSVALANGGTTTSGEVVPPTITVTLTSAPATSGTNPPASNTAKTVVDGSGNVLMFDGLIAQGLNNATTSNGASLGAQVAQPAAASGILALSDIDAVLMNLYQQAAGDPDLLIMNPVDNVKLTNLVVAAGQLRYVIDAGKASEAAHVLAPFRVTAYLNKVTGREIPIVLDRYCPMGTMLFLSLALPYPVPEIDHAIEIETNQDYWGIDFAVTTSQWQFANYVDETLKVYFLGGLGVLRGIVPSV